MTADRGGVGDDHLGALVATFGLEVGVKLDAWAANHGVGLTPLEALTGGTTDAQVVLVLERPSVGPPRKTVIKVCRLEQEGARLPEPGRHIKAQAGFPEFAERHIVRMLYDPVHVGDDRWALFLEPAGGGPPGTVSMSNLVSRALTPLPASAPPGGSPGEFHKLGGICRDALLAVLGDWSPAGGRTNSMTVGGFVGRLLDGRHEPGGGVHSWLAAYRPHLLKADVLWTDVDGERCPNPLGLAPGGALGEGRELLALCGPSHGDLHAGNLFVPVKPVRVRGEGHLPYSTFWLGDLERFDADGLLASDPVHLLLSLAALQLHEMRDPPARQALRHFLIHGDVHSGGLVFGWLSFVVGEIRAAVPEWIQGFPTEWRQQTLLAMVAWGLVFAGRRTTSDGQRDWFFGLAALAAKAYLDDGGPAGRLVAVSPRSDPPTGADGGSEVRRLEVLPDRDALGDRTAGGEHIARAAVGRPSSQRRRLSPELLKACDQLAERVREQWAEAADDFGLTSPEPVPVRWEKASGAGADEVTPLLRNGQVAVHPSDDWRLGHHPPATGLFPLYCSIGSGTGRLVITGRAGAGKSATAILLALDILAYRAQLDHESDRAAVAVPVILTPHDWDPEEEGLISWMTQQIVADYPLLGSRWRGRKAVEELVRGRRIALFLDGFDEIAPERRAGALKALSDEKGVIVVVLSRPVASVDMADVPTVELQPVALDEAVDYLARCYGAAAPAALPTALDRVRRAPHSALALTLASPLMLGLLRDVYRQPSAVCSGIDDLLDARRFPHRDDVEKHLLRQVLANAYPQKQEAEHAERWLESFAHLMSENDTRELAWWQLKHSVSRWKRFAVNSVLTAVAPVLLFGLVGTLGGQPAGGFVCGLAIGLMASAFDEIVVDRDKGRGARKATTVGIAAGYVLAGTATGAMAGVLLMGAGSGLPNGTLAGAVAGGLGGAVAAHAAARHLATSGRPTSAVDMTRTPGDDWREGVRQTRRFGRLLGATVGLTLALVAWRAGEPVMQVAISGVAGLVAMPFAVMALSPRTKMTVTALALWRRHRSPVRVLRFLEEAREKDVLRAVGPVYQFRHALLQDLLAETWEEHERWLDGS